MKVRARFDSWRPRNRQRKLFEKSGRSPDPTVSTPSLTTGKVVSIGLFGHVKHVACRLASAAAGPGQPSTSPDRSGAVRRARVTEREPSDAKCRAH